MLSRWKSLAGWSMVILGLIAVPALAQTGSGFRVISVTPSTINPGTGQVAAVAYTVPSTANYRIYIRNSAGAEVRGIVQYKNMPAGTRSTSWNGRSTAGAIVPNGAYTIVIAGTTSTGTPLTTGTGTITVNAGGGTTPPPATTGAFKVTGVSPTSFDPAKSQTATVTYTVPSTANYRVYVRNSAGSEVRGIIQYKNMPASTRAHSWNGKNTAGAIVPAGTYTFVIEGTTSTGAPLTTGTGTVTVLGGTTPPPTPDPDPDPTPAGAFKVTGVSPASFDPAKSQTATVTYTVPSTANYRVYVRNSAGSEVRGIIQYKNMPASTRAHSWNGKNTAGAIVPAGTYTFVIEGTTSSGAALTTGTGTVTVTGSTTPAPTSEFKVTGVSPTSIDPSKAQTATVTYTVPVTADYRVYVRNSAGSEVRAIQSYTGATAGTKTNTWDGKNASGQTVANGTYTFVIEGKATSGAAITSATGNVAVNLGTVTPPPDPQPSTGELGQIIDGAGSANFAWLKNKGYKCGVAFKAPKSGAINQITLQWKSSSSGYGQSTDGSYGIYTFEIQTDNPSNHMPSGTVIGSVSGMKRNDGTGGYSDGAFTLKLTANLVKDQIYHLVISNTHSSPSSNWSSPNGLMVRVQPWDGTGCRTAYFNGSTWSPWSSQDNPWNTARNNNVNGQHIPLMLKWSDGSVTGDPYYSAAISAGAYMYGSYKAGQLMVWDRPSATIRKIGISVGKRGTPGSSLIYHLEEVGGSQLATGTLATPAQVSNTQQMIYATLPQAITLQQGRTYRLWMESPSSSNQSNCYYQYPPYGEMRPAEWLEASWGGTKSTFTDNRNGSWVTSYPNKDFVFSLQ